MGCRVLVVEDDQSTRALYESFLRGRGHEVVSVKSAEDAIKVFNPSFFDCILTDYKLPKMNGIDLVRSLRNQDDRTGVVVVTADDRDAVDEQCGGLSVWSVLPKPVPLQTLADNISAACEFSHMPAEEEAKLTQEFLKETKKMKDLHTDLLNETSLDIQIP